jgi:hypothetical protein
MVSAGFSLAAAGAAALARAGEFPHASSDRDPAQGSFGGVVREANASVVEDARERRPTVEAIVDRLADLAICNTGARLRRQSQALFLRPRIMPAALDRRNDLDAFHGNV